MKSIVVKIRLRPAELEKLDRICQSKNGSRNRSEMIRMMILREHKRRSPARSSVVSDAECASDHRIGRPRKAPAVELAASESVAAAPVQIPGFIGRLILWPQ